MVFRRTGTRVLISPVSSEFCCVLMQLVGVEDDFVAFSRRENLEFYGNKTELLKSSECRDCVLFERI
jgi:hypothetical protein